MIPCLSESFYKIIDVGDITKGDIRRHKMEHVKVCKSFH